ncbi:PEP/pyruvate-binding domain-containing protein [Solemya velesiana gill symbiont]|uniref:PEP/pyruvate-binding domain-containing protein n=1 Tax=Solemya velesiana gill symbiont TaxID=1918948 RepID=UPI00099823AE|nr:PEP/pyruvate-binding domain-containing protein [Solemya velesiana gill symbiont]
MSGKKKSPPVDPPRVVSIGEPVADWVGVTPELVGVKAYNLLRMAIVGLPVPPAFVLSTSVCREFLGKESMDRTMVEQIKANMRQLESRTQKGFGGTRRPLLVSVRSGAPVSMPGMLDTILNVGLNGQTVEGVIRMTGNPRLAWDSYRRLIQSFAEVVHGSGMQTFNTILAEHMALAHVEDSRELDALSMRAVCHDLLDVYHTATGRRFPPGSHDPADRGCGGGVPLMAQPAGPGVPADA